MLLIAPCDKNEREKYMYTVLDYEERGVGGKNSWRGNCSPKLVEELLGFYKYDHISDYMVGSGTTSDVAEKLNIDYNCYDLHSGFNLLEDEIKERNPFIFWHPPYYDIIKYAGNMYSVDSVKQKYGYDPVKYDLSYAKDWNNFVKKMNYCMMKQFTSLEKGGRMAVLVGDIKKKGKLLSMILEIVKPGTVENILIKTQHNCKSDSKNYSNNNFIRINHEYVLIVRKDQTLVYDIQLARNFEMDIRDMRDATWKDVVASCMEEIGGTATLEQLYDKIEGHRKTEGNRHYKEKIRQTLQINNFIFKRVGKGVWKLRKC